MPPTMLRCPQINPMKAEEEIAQMLAALINLDAQSAPGLKILVEARLEGMQIALAWVLNNPLPGLYPEWFRQVQNTWHSDTFCE